MIKLCGLWENTDKNGNIYFQGKAEEKKKEGQDKPAWHRENYVVGSPKGMSGPSGEGGQADEERPDEPEEEDEDEVPF